MYKEESGLEVALLAIFVIALIPAGIFVNGMMLSYAWAELLRPIFPQLPMLAFWQAVGLSTFVSLFTMHLSKAETKADRGDTLKSVIIKVLVQWALYFVIIWLVSLTY